MILFDTSQVIVAAASDYHRKTKETIDLNLLRHIALSTIVTLRNKLQRSGEVVLCLDGKNYWRRGIFPHYKSSRKKAREQSTMDWKAFYASFDALKEEFKHYLPYTVIEVDTAEADDIIAVLAKHYSPEVEVIIVSSDKDLIQLQEHYDNVRQFSPYHNGYTTIKSRGYSLLHHILKGDSGDGIPNFRSPDDVFLSNQRQKPVTQKLLNEADLEGIEAVCTSVEEIRNIERNRNLIDLRRIPDALEATIIQEYQHIKANKPVHTNLFEYLAKNSMQNLINRLETF